MPAFLGLALLLRLPAVLFADGYEFVDQQFQYIDPAWHLASGDDWDVAWEYECGIRSWVYPGFLAGLFRMLMAVGLDAPLAMMRAVRGLHAIVSLLPLWVFWLAINRWRPVAAPRLPLLLFAASGMVITVGVQPSAPALAATMALAAVLAFHGPRWFPLAGGVLLGLAFCCRFQDAVFGPAVVAVGLWQRRWRAVGWFTLGCVPGILLQGFVDQIMNGQFLGSPWHYFRINVLEGVSTRVGTKPWYFYLLIVPPLVMMLPPWIGSAWQRLRAGSLVLPGAMAAAALHLVAHSLVSRKAVRFEYGALCLLVAVIAAGLGSAATSRWTASHRWALVVAQLLLFCWASFYRGHQGAIAAALALRAEPAFHGELLIVDAEPPVAGGAYYLRREHLALRAVEAAALPHELRGEGAQDAFVLTCRQPLDAAVVDACGLEQFGMFTGMLDLRQRDRRFLYRRRR